MDGVINRFKGEDMDIEELKNNCINFYNEYRDLRRRWIEEKKEFEQI